MTIKGPSKIVDGALVREEFETNLEEWDARRLFGMAVVTVSKKRYFVGDFDVDVFSDGLILAEIELATPDAPFEKPDWLGEEVSEDHAYSNLAIALRMKDQQNE